jgi:putative oxidoreductase
MKTVLGKFEPQAYALLRIVAGLLFAQHGAQKLFGALGGEGVPIASLMGLAGVIEFFGGLLIAIGLFTSPVAFIASGEMAVAYFMAHASSGLTPIQNRGELAVLYCFVFLYMAARGSGLFSVDAARGAKRA